jgi:hypothetical protein
VKLSLIDFSFKLILFFIYSISILFSLSFFYSSSITLLTFTNLV